MKSLQKFRFPISALAVSILVACFMLIADAAGRRSWEDVDVWPHVRAGVLLYGVAGMLGGLLLGGVILVTQTLSVRLGRVSPRSALPVAVGVGAAVAAAVAAPTAFFAFSGHGIQASRLARFGPYGLIAGAFVAAVVAITLVMWSVERAGKARYVAPALVSGLFLATTLAIVYVDLTVYISLYSTLHTAAESIAALCAVVALLPWVALLSERYPRWWLGAAGVLTTGGLLASVLYGSSPELRAWTETALRHAWREPVYAGRMLSRLQLAESYLRDPDGFRDVTMSSIVKLRRNFDLSTTARSTTWDTPPPEPEAVRKAVIEMRGEAEYNILIYYVDTLRADVARDPAIMPAVNRFAAESLNFQRAYSTGSNTVHALPGLTGGSFDLLEEHRNDFVRVAEQGGMKTALVIAQSAHEFLSRLLPSFKFNETLTVPDYAAGNDTVWGYGADQPTAERIVTKAQQWLVEHRSEPFLLWLFNFDVHNWREIDEAYVTATARALSVPEEGLLAWRYRVAARSIDAQFGRLLTTLQDLSLSERTIVVFVSDHGEALGREGFWVHSIFLWEPLVRVPLLIRIPNIPAKTIHDIVSLVDVAPTLARYIVHGAEMSGYHGEDLLSYLLTKRPARRLPLLLAGTSKEQLVRLGIIDPPSPWKLVLPLEGGMPELYDLTAADPDSRDLAAQRPQQVLGLLNQLVRAPLFPRMSPEGTNPAPSAQPVNHSK